MIGPDFLSRIERTSLIVAVVLAAGALVWPSAGPMTAVAVLGGALLSAISYFGVRRGVDGLTTALAGGSGTRAGIARVLTMLVGRYALLALIAYVMISRLRLSPLGVLMGVSVIPLAAFIAVLAGLNKKIAPKDHGTV